MVRYAQRITGDLERARDVVQETFLKLCRECPADIDGHAAEWLFTVCRNQAVDVKRKERRMSVLAETERAAPESRDLSPPEAAELHDTAGQVLRLLDELPDNQQEVIRLKFQSGLSYREISGVTGLTVSNVGFLIHTGMKRLREQMLRLEARG
jgi:RNA polymerase sigma-70 factor (ECF subfamily)